MNNSVKYPEAWKIFKSEARNIEGEEDSVNGKYAIHHPFESKWLYADDPGILFMKFKDEFYKPDINSPSVYGKIQYITQTF